MVTTTKLCRYQVEFTRILNGGRKKHISRHSSLTGWGNFCNGQRASGQWTETEKSHHINYLELLSAFFWFKMLC
ncbi:hypothetical protein NQ317_008295 [Molorchus minor]|uniref:Uncharacterized protein n=1 Tax=Molorchus minor TaxID=1323400 RepID=A0ABQ9ISB2_9CUCU|nr:hypothetical protein NQ317_008295 [Molorchus minor]